MSIIKLQSDDLARAVCELIETPPTITARQARAATRGFSWCSCCDYHSPQGFWQAEIGTDHGDESMDDSPVRWQPIHELTDLIEVAWLLVDEMHKRGWLLHILQMTDGWVVNGKWYDKPGSWGDATLTSDMVQEVGDSAPEAICRAVLAGLRIGATP